MMLCALALAAPAPAADHAPCVVPCDDLEIVDDTVLCPGTYYIPDRGEEGVLRLATDGVELRGDNTLIVGDGVGFGIRVGDDGGRVRDVTVEGVGVRGYQVNFYAANASDLTVRDNDFLYPTSYAVEMGNPDFSVENIHLDGNRIIADSTANGLSYNAWQPARDLLFENNLVDVGIDGFVLEAHSNGTAFHLRNNTYESCTGEIINIDGHIGSIIENETILAASNVLVWHYSTDCVFRGNFMPWAAFQLEGSIGNIFYGNAVGASVNLFPYHEDGTPSSDNLIFDNVLYGGRNPGMNWGLLLSQAHDNIIVHNTVYGAAAGIILESESICNIVANNIFSVSSGDRALIELESGCLDGTEIDYNLYHNAAVGFVGELDGTRIESLAQWRLATGVDQHSLAADPEFFDAPGRDLRLRSASPAIGAADPTLPGPPWDFLGRPRPLGSPRADLGALEAPQ